MAELGVLASAPVEGAEYVELRPLEPDDWTAVEEIYWDGMRGGLATLETETPPWEAWDERYRRDNRLVAEALGEVVGWAALLPVSSRRVYRGVAEVSVYVAAAWRGKGVGRRLLEELIAGSEAAGTWTLQASVFPENPASLGLFEHCGFRRVGVRERIGKRDGLWRDTILLERRSPTVD